MVELKGRRHLIGEGEGHHNKGNGNEGHLSAYPYPDEVPIGAPQMKGFRVGTRSVRCSCNLDFTNSLYCRIQLMPGEPLPGLTPLPDFFVDSGRQVIYFAPVGI